MKARLWVQGLFIFVGWASVALAKPEMELNLDPPHRVKMGQRCQFTVDLKWRRSEGDYFFTKPEFSLEGMKVEEMGESNEIFQKGGEAWSHKVFRFLLEPLHTGKGRIHPFRVKFLNPMNPEEGYLEVPGSELKIVADRSKLYRGVGAAAGILALAGAFTWVLRARFGKKSAGPEETGPTLEGRYVSSLNQASLSKDTFEGGKIFLSYLTEKYALGKSPITAGEIVKKLQGKVVSEELKTLKALLERLDESHYATRGLSSSEGRDLYREMIHFIEGKKVVGI